MHEPRLVKTDKGLSLVGDGVELRGDLARMLPRLRAQNLHRELLVRAARIRGAHGPLHAVDATAGMGEDALLLAAAGFYVDLYERDAVIAALLRDSLQRAANVPELAPVVGRMRLHEQDSVEALATITYQPDVVFLDPMFPAKRKSAATKKKLQLLQLLQLLEQPCEDEDALLQAAMAARPRKVVIKRPAKGPFLGGMKPSHSLGGKVVRYDVIVPS